MKFAIALLAVVVAQDAEPAADECDPPCAEGQCCGKKHVVNVDEGEDNSETQVCEDPKKGTWTHENEDSGKVEKWTFACNNAQYLAASVAGLVAAAYL